MDPGYLGLTSSAGSDLLAQAKSVIGGSWYIVLLAIAIPLGFYLVKKLIGLMPKK
jgi:hypothetical protein